MGKYIVEIVVPTYIISQSWLKYTNINKLP